MEEDKETGVPLLQLKGIVKNFPGVRALDDVSFELRRGEVHVLVGENGAGKSTLGKIIVGALPLDKGKVYLDGREVHILTPLDGKELGINMIFQEFNLVPHLSVAENIFLGRQPIRKKMRMDFIDWVRMDEEAGGLLTMLGSGINPKTLVRNLNVAEQQMVELAKALSLESRVIIMDEPTAALSSQEVDQLFKVIVQLGQKGIGIIYISHRLEEIAKIGHRATILRDGKYIDTVPVQGTKIDTLIQMMVGRQMLSKFPWEKREIGEEVLRVEKLCRVGAFQDVSFCLRRGEILGLAGLKGAGRASLARAVFGAYPFDGGSIMVEGKEVHHRNPRDAIRKGLAFLPSDRRRHGLNLLFGVSKNITLASLKRFAKRGWLRLKGESEVAKEYQEKLDIKTPTLEREVMYLSGGNQQKVVLAKWLCSQAKVIIFDEPTRGIDVGVKYEVHKLMVELAKQGVGIIMISSELPEILGMSDRTLVMKEGRIVAEFARDEATQEDILRYAA